ncbi:TFIIB-type zinc ribbon-containing protein [Candidatus Laterigemmans baculatus]|uniref:TFIIB-type zinc ribbon-containing protein n=1 Tax=Candidatus Laterigemmans baculatus TaxID=2770505 RepID=UPI0013DB1630|nr:zf-TFIIB domain-containing protein [Candidatus Laterigemmans baculatus]
MKCPVCEETDLVMSERQNIEIDYCPKCRGIWLDRGELDKIIERANQYEAEQAAQRQIPLPPPNQAQQPYPPRSDQKYYDERGKYYKKKKPFWMELFD